MKRKKRILGVLMIVVALIIMQLPVTEADAASSASDFNINGSTLVKYQGSDTNVTIPDSVEIIGRYAFEDNTNVERVVIPNSVTRIDPYAFWGCTKLSTVVLGRGLKEVGDFAFTNCMGLKQISIPTGVSSIGIEAFADCVNLTDIVIPAETVNIHETAFNGCYRLTIQCDAGTVADEYAKSFYERQKEMPEYEDVSNYEPSATAAPATPAPSPTPSPAPTEIPANVLETTQIVGNRAVFLADNQQLPVYVGAPKIESENPPLANIMEEWDDGILKYAIVDGKVVADQAYYRSGELEDVVLPDGIIEIGQFSFARSTLRGITLPQGVESIDYGAFYHCDNLTNVTLPDTIMCVEPKAFSYTAWVERFLNIGNDSDSAVSSPEDFLIEGGVLVAYRGNAETVEIPEGVRVIAGEAFLDHGEIRRLVLPDSLLVIGEGAFEGCSHLRQIEFGKNVEEIKDRAFLGISSLLNRVSLPESVKKLGLQAFGYILVNYEGEEPMHTYEVSASRLSNEAYRVYDYGDAEAEEPGVTVVGMEGVEASLEGADKNYTLAVTLAENTKEMEDACWRSFQSLLPEDMIIYDLTLTDNSGIPLIKLGSQALTVIMPVPETLSGKKLKLLALDRNGQPEELTIEYVMLAGRESVRFQTNHLSLFGLYGAGAAESNEELLEINVETTSLSAPPVRQDTTTALFLAGGALLITGVILLLTSGRSMRRVKD